MKLARPGSSFGSFKKRPLAVLNEDDEDLEIVPPKGKPGLKSLAESNLNRRARLNRTAARIETEDERPRRVKPPAPLEVEDDYEVEDDALPPPKRRQALALSEHLGIQDFEVDSVRPTRQEAVEEESDETGKEVYEAARRNSRVMSTPAILPGDNSPDRVRGVLTMFGQRADVILGLLEHEDRTDGALSLIQRTLLQTMVDVLPVIERGVRRSQGRKGVIPLNQTVSQIRELVADLQSLRDRGHLGATIVERVLRPAFLDIGVQLAQGFNNMMLSAKLKMADEDFRAYSVELQDTQRGLATYMQQQYAEVKEGVSSSLS